MGIHGLQHSFGEYHNINGRIDPCSLKLYSMQAIYVFFFSVSILVMNQVGCEPVVSYVLLERAEIPIDSFAAQPFVMSLANTVPVAILPRPNLS